MKQWYLIYTKPRKEQVAVQNLRRQGFEVYLPLIQRERRQRGHWLEVTEPLFPRYLFIHLLFGRDNIGPIRSTIGVHDLVRFSGKPAVVPEQIIESLRYSADPETGLHRYGHPLFQPGDRVLVGSGPLAGLRAVFLAESGQQRALILLEMLGRHNHITVARDLLSLA